MGISMGQTFNISKCKVVYLGVRNPGHTYTMAEHQLSTQKKERDIEVTVNSNLH
jgi:hypothetical protein